MDLPIATSIPGILEHKHQQIFSLDYLLIYQINTTLHAQLYAQGILDRFTTFIPASNAQEYKPGIVHISSIDFDSYQCAIADLINNPHKSSERLLLQHAISHSISNLAKANYMFEKSRSSQVLLNNLLDTAIKAMSFYNFNDQTLLPDCLDQLMIDRVAKDCLYQVLMPTVTPYMTLLINRVNRYQHTQPHRSIQQVQFLIEFDPIEEPMLTDTWKTLPISVEQLTCVQRKARHAHGWAYLKPWLQHYYPDHAIHLIELIELSATAANHEEARHYWQARTMANLRCVCRERKLDLRTTTIKMLRNPVQ